VDKQNVGIGALIVALLAGLAVGFPFVASNTPASLARAVSQQQSSSWPYEKHRLPKHSALDVITDSFDGDPAQLPTKQVWSQVKPHWSANLVEPSPPDKLRVIIASLPDPTAPELREKFDDRIDAIQRAAETDGYVLDSVDLPWPGSETGSGMKLDQEIDLRWRQGGEEDNQDTPSNAPYISANTNSAESGRYLNDPGILLFHHDDKAPSNDDKDPSNKDKGSRLLVFIVGETPTTGVHKRALRSALDQTAWLCGWEDTPSPVPLEDQVSDLVKCEDDNELGMLAPWLCQWEHELRPVPLDYQVFDLVKCDSDELRMLAPSYSGSEESLEVTLNPWRDGLAQEKRPHLTMISGTTTVRHLFQEGWIKDWITFTTTKVAFNIGQFKEFLQSQFSALEFHFSQIANSEFLRSHLDSKLDKVAILAEAGTLYGQSFYPNSDVMVLHFPLYISDVRRASEGRTVGVVQGPTRLSNIKLPAEENGAIDYLPPHYSPRSVASDQIVLQNLLETIHRERVRFIGIVASDVEDRIFLAQQIRESCPDTSVFLFDADMIYLHSDFNADLLGTVVFSTYPLFATNRLWTHPFMGAQERHQYPTEDAEGVFNATLALLENTDAMEDYAPPFQQESSAPVLWASIVGKDDLWPLGYYSLPDPAGVERTSFKRGTQDPNVPLINRGLYSGSFTILFLIATLVAGGWAVLLLVHYPPFETFRPKRLWFDSLVGFSLPSNSKEDLELLDQRRSFLIAITIGLLALYTVIATFLSLPFWCATFGSFDGTIDWFPWGSARLYFVLLAIFISFITWVTCAFAIASLLFMYSPQMRLRTTADAKAGWSASLKYLLSSPTCVSSLLFAIAAALYCVSILLPWPGIWHYGWAAPLYLFYRGTNLGNGVSPIVPIVFVGTAALALLFSSLRRIAILRVSRDSSATLGFTQTFNSFNGTVLLEEQLKKYLKERPNHLPGAQIFYWLGVFGGGWFFFMRPNGSIDGKWFDFLIILGAFAVFVAVVWALLRLVLAWRAMRELLRRLYRHPSRSAYEDFRKALPGHQGITFTESTLPLTSLETSLEQVREMIRLAEVKGAGALPADLVNRIRLLKGNLADAEKDLSAALRANAEGEWEEAVNSRAEAEAAISKLGVEITALLEGNWRAPAPGTTTVTPGERRAYRMAELFFASRVVDLLREVFPHFRNLMTFVTIAILLALLAMSSYPFAQRDTLLTIAWLSVGSAVGTMGYVFVTMNSDRVLSLLSGTTPGQITWNSTLVTQILLYGILPVLGLLGVQFPGQAGSILSWFSKLGGRPG
jgi:hypothetical protein